MSDFFFREGVIQDVDPVNMTCSLHYGDVRAGEMSHNVPMPNIVGAGNAGLFVNLMKGTRVIAAYLADRSKDIVVIIAVLPSILQRDGNYNQLSTDLIDKNRGTLAYPRTMKIGDSYLSAHNGPFLWLKNDNSLHISSKNGHGIFLMPNRENNSHNMFQLANNHSIEGSGGKLHWGRVKRNMNNVGWNNSNEFYTDINRDAELREIGFWPAESISKISTPMGKRNPALSEYRMVISEFATEFGFAGIDKEQGKVDSQRDAMSRNPTAQRDREPSNVLKPSEGELIEIVGGNLIDINGLALDINYGAVTYSFTIPTSDFEARMEEAKLKSRRGIGYHFKLSTNIKSDDIDTSSKDFIFDIDKEGLLKVNIPKSSTTGNIPYVNDVNFQAKQGGRLHDIVSQNESFTEKIPVHTRDRNGNPVFTPAKSTRETGVRFINTDDTYFPIADTSSKTTIRVNTTKHHNIYAAAERLIANQITDIQAPFAYSKEKDLTVAGVSFTIPEVPTNKDDYSLNSAFEVAYDAKSGDDNPTDIRNLFYSAVRVAPGLPAIATGGDTVVAGRTFQGDDKIQPIISNYFASKLNAETGKVATTVVGVAQLTNVTPHGGVSANINLEGSMEMSVGADNVDGKSIVLDTAGSLIAWLGKDKNGRSMIFQSDGDVLVNIGGSYPKPAKSGDIPIMNAGRFDLRVNVVDKGFYDADANSNRKKDGAVQVGDKPNSSDYIISISEHGLVIAGMKSGAPMIIRNDGPLVLESASDKVTIKGMSVETVEFGKTPK